MSFSSISNGVGSLDTTASVAGAVAGGAAAGGAAAAGGGGAVVAGGSSFRNRAASMASAIVSSVASLGDAMRTRRADVALWFSNQRKERSRELMVFAVDLLHEASKASINLYALSEKIGVLVEALKLGNFSSEKEAHQKLAQILISDLEKLRRQEMTERKAIENGKGVMVAALEAEAKMDRSLDVEKEKIKNAFKLCCSKGLFQRKTEEICSIYFVCLGVIYRELPKRIKSHLVELVSIVEKTESPEMRNSRVGAKIWDLFKASKPSDPVPLLDLPYMGSQNRIMSLQELVLSFNLVGEVCYQNSPLLMEEAELEGGTKSKGPLISYHDNLVPMIISGTCEPDFKMTENRVGALKRFIRESKELSPFYKANFTSMIALLSPFYQEDQKNMIIEALKKEADASKLFENSIFVQGLVQELNHLITIQSKIWQFAADSGLLTLFVFLQTVFKHGCQMHPQQMGQPGNHKNPSFLKQLYESDAVSKLEGKSSPGYGFKIHFKEYQRFLELMIDFGGNLLDVMTREKIDTIQQCIKGESRNDGDRSLMYEYDGYRFPSNVEEWEYRLVKRSNLRIYEESKKACTGGLQREINGGIMAGDVAASAAASGAAAAGGSEWSWPRELTALVMEYEDLPQMIGTEVQRRRDELEKEQKKVVQDAALARSAERAASGAAAAVSSNLSGAEAR